MSSLDAFIVEGLRSPIGRHAGAISSVRPDNLLAGVIQQLLEKSPFPIDAVEDVIVGCTNQAGEDCRNIGRNAALLSGLPSSVGGQTVNRLCGSGLAAVADAARAATLGHGDVFIAGGVESMSRAPYVISKGAQPFDRAAALFDTTIGARFPNGALTKLYGADSMAETADNVAREIQIKRIEADTFAMRSQEKYDEAKKRGFFAGEIAPTRVVGRKGDEHHVKDDEHPRPGTTLDQLARLKTLNADGVTTAGNASGINDGAAAVLIANAKAVNQVGAKPLARIVSAAIAGVEPRLMGLGPVPASNKALERAGLTLKDVDVIEINEAFASQVLGCLRLLAIDYDDERVNANGGGIAIGHPLGASGARLALTAARQLHNVNGRYALVTMCIGIGQGIAIVIERC